MKKSVSFLLTLLITVLSINIHAAEQVGEECYPGKVNINFKNESEDKMLDVVIYSNCSGEKFRAYLKPGKTYVIQEGEISFPAFYRIYAYDKNDLEKHISSGRLGGLSEQPQTEIFSVFDNNTAQYENSYDASTNTASFNLTLK